MHFSSSLPAARRSASLYGRGSSVLFYLRDRSSLYLRYRSVLLSARVRVQEVRATFRILFGGARVMMSFSPFHLQPLQGNLSFFTTNQYNSHAQYHLFREDDIGVFSTCCQYKDGTCEMVLDSTSLVNTNDEELIP